MPEYLSSFKLIYDDEDGMAIYSTQFGILFEQRTLHKAIQRIMSYQELFYYSLCGRQYINKIIMNELNTLQSQFFDEI